MRAGYLGPEGTFSHEALLAFGDSGDELVPLSTVHDVVVAVQDGRVDRALAPIENSREGAVSATLDALAFDAPDVMVVGEAVMAIHHLLVAAGPMQLEDIEVVLSHPQPLAQCAATLRRLMPQAKPVAATSTAEAVRSVVQDGGAKAAIGTATAAKAYGAHLLAEGIEDEAGNATRFVWLERHAGQPVATGTGQGVKGRTSLLFHGTGDGTAGWLVDCLSEFASRNVNLTKIESRPLRSLLGHYIFHVDLDGLLADPAVDAAVEALRAHCEEVRVLGSYATDTG
jgi:prephenate dehydratase